MVNESSGRPAAAAACGGKPVARDAEPAAPPRPAIRLVRPPAVAPHPRLFVVHAPEDAWFVEGFLLEALRLPEGEVLISSKLEPGAVIVDQIARGALSPVTVVVVSPAFLASPWAQFAQQLAMHQSIDAAGDGSATLVPAILADCELPLLSRFRVPLDFRNRDREHWEEETGRLRQKLAAPLPVVAEPPCPYPGIRPFTMEDAARFHGRDEEVRDLLGRLRDGEPELYVIGPSGSGKSSLVAAGLVPRLHASPELAGAAFLVRQLRPGVDPTAALAGVLEATATEQADAAMRWLGDAVGRVLAAHPDHDRLLIFVDQLEELFTTAASAPRAGFIAALRALRRDPRVALVLTLRADFYAQLMESTLWADLDGQLSRLDVGPLRGDELQAAIEAPARALVVYFEPVLIERLLHDVADEPGALPLLQDTLLALWHQRTRGLLRLTEYEAMSDGEQTGLAVTLARRADSALRDLSPGRRAIARRVFLRLVQFGDGTATTRRQQTRAALATAADAPDDIDVVIHHLADRRLITTSGGDDAAGSPRIDLAHEVLLTAWPALDAWIRTRRDDEQRRRVLEDKAAEWVQRGRGPYRLLDADELREVRGWLTEDTARDLGVSEAVQGLLARSEAALMAEVAKVNDGRRRSLRWVMLAFVVLAGVGVAVTVLVSVAENLSRKGRRQLITTWIQTFAAEVQRRETNRQVVQTAALWLETQLQACTAERERRAARRQRARNYVSEGYQLLRNDHPAEAAPYLLAAREAGDEGEPLGMLFRWATQGLPLVQLVHDGAVQAVAWSPDGTKVATASLDHGARIWNAVSGQAVTPPLAHQGEVYAVAWSPDSTRVATASQDETARVWSAVSGQPVTPPLAHHGRVTAVAWSSDGMRVATASQDGTARVWNAASGQAVTPPLVHHGQVTAVAWSPDGTRVATASDDHTARVWNADSGQPVTPPLAHKDRVHAIAWSPNGRRVATAGDDHMARVWSAVTGQAVTPPLAHDDKVMAIAWRPDGRRLATASDDRLVRVWNTVTGQRVTPPLTHTASVSDVAWSPDGQWVATASDDHTARVWDAVTGQPMTPPLVHKGRVHAVVWSPDGTHVATASEDGIARVWEAVSRHAVTPPLHQDKVSMVAWSPDGTQVATASDDHTARVWEAASGQPVTPPLPHDNGVRTVAWSPDGSRVATASYDGTARVWDAVSGDPVTPPFARGEVVAAVSWSPEGNRVATASYDGTARVWDAATGQPVTPVLTHQGTIWTVAWSPDGTRLATASSDHTAQVWDAVTGQPLTLPLSHHEGVWRVAWSPDGTRLATASQDATARVWNAVSGQPVTPPLMHKGWIVAVAWSPDGTRVATASQDETAQIWSAASGLLLTPPLTHARGVNSISWSPDGTLVATASQDGTARVWDAVSGQALTPPLAHRDSVNTVAWSSTGRRIVTASDDHTARVWDVSGDIGTLADWHVALQRCDYRLNDAGVLVVRDPEPAGTPASPGTTGKAGGT
jgi:WD40 repeat protein